MWQASQLVKSAALTASLALVISGCAEPRAGRDRHGAPAAVYVPPSEARPIVPNVADPMGGLVFGGLDGSKRIKLYRTPDIRQLTTDRTGHVAAALRLYGKSRRCLLIFYDVEAQAIGQVDIAAGASMMGVGRRGEAIVRVTVSPIDFRDRVLPNQPPLPSWTTFHHVAADGVVQVLDVPPIHAVWFADSPGFLLVVSTAENPWNQPEAAWRLMRFASPGRLLWEATFPTEPWRVRPWPCQPQVGFDVAAYISRTTLQFRRDGSFEVWRPPASRFAEANPNYADRTATHYERDYLPKAVAQLADAARLDRTQRKQAREFLGTFIRGWTAAFVEGGGEIYYVPYHRLIDALDGGLREILDDGQYQAYLKWRDKENRNDNAIGFLFHALTAEKRKELQDRAISKIVVRRS